MTTTHFITTDTFDIIDFSEFKARADVIATEINYGFSPEAAFIDEMIDIHDLGVARIHIPAEPALELWELNDIDPDAYTYDSGEDKYYRVWNTRNMTAPELELLNYNRQFEFSETRRIRYIYESDPLFFMAYRGETTFQAYDDKVIQIKTEVPKPAIIVIPE